MRRLAAFACLAAAMLTGCNDSPVAPGTIPPPVVEPPAPPPAPPPTLGVTRILAFGDSITEGVTSPGAPALALTAGIPASYPYKMLDLLAARYTAQTVTVLNAGKAGEKATEGRLRLGSVLSEARPELLLLMEGTNDLNWLASLGVTDVSPVVNALEDMVREASRRGAHVMIATLTPQRRGGAKAPGEPLIARLNDEVKVMASKKGAILVDVNAQFPLSLIGQDGLHPTDAGTQKLAEIFLEAIKAGFERAAPAASARRAGILGTPWPPPPASPL